MDPIKCGEPGADFPTVLSRQLATDGIVVNPAPPAPEEEGQNPTHTQTHRTSCSPLRGVVGRMDEARDGCLARTGGSTFCMPTCTATLGCHGDLPHFVSVVSWRGPAIFSVVFRPLVCSFEAQQSVLLRWECFCVFAARSAFWGPCFLPVLPCRKNRYGGIPRARPRSRVTGKHEPQNAFHLRSGLLFSAPRDRYRALERAESKEKSGGLFTCGEDNADEDAEDMGGNPRELEETKEREQLYGGGRGGAKTLLCMFGPTVARGGAAVACCQWCQQGCCCCLCGCWF